MDWSTCRAAFADSVSPLVAAAAVGVDNPVVGVVVDAEVEVVYTMLGMMVNRLQEPTAIGSLRLGHQQNEIQKSMAARRADLIRSEVQSRGR